MKLAMVTIGLVAACTVACASRPMPTSKVSSSAAAVRSAQEVGAEQSPEAALHLRMAKDQLARARALLDDGEYEKAEWLLTRAESDAEVAIAIARETRAKQAAERAAGSVRQASTQDSIGGGQATPPNQ
jgi:hypothetical protein